MLCARPDVLSVLPAGREYPDMEPITACGNGIRPDHVRYKPWFIEEGPVQKFVRYIDLW